MASFFFTSIAASLTIFKLNTTAWHEGFDRSEDGGAFGGAKTPVMVGAASATSRGTISTSRDLDGFGKTDDIM